jgi:hypothetical protein
MASAGASDGPMSPLSTRGYPSPEPPPGLRRRSYPHRTCHPCPRFKVSPMSPPVHPRVWAPTAETSSSRVRWPNRGPPVTRSASRWFPGAPFGRVEPSSGVWPARPPGRAAAVSPIAQRCQPPRAAGVGPIARRRREEDVSGLTRPSAGSRGWPLERKTAVFRLHKNSWYLLYSLFRLKKKNSF